MTGLLNDDLAAVRSRLRWHSDEAPGQRCAVVGYAGTVSSGAALAYASGWAERTMGAVVIVHVDAAAGMTFAECASATAGLVAPVIPPGDMSRAVVEAMAHVSARWAYLSARGDVAAQLERVAVALKADVVVVGRSSRPRFRIAPSVGRRLLKSSRHVTVVV
ncbi:MAG: hypothetical protein ACRDVG_00190 [Jatrophihabitantaceae bacterium]